MTSWNIDLSLPACFSDSQYIELCGTLLLSVIKIAALRMKEVNDGAKKEFGNE
ncbi:unnamed protein product [Chironomus riparius]|uniref:Uncharacterized protein n=1 Tax=Chironomus riparius TaxID=315576 RepID=A0A9N9RQC6_9DIPT|nr:unnamed protein product [Chironomus riparius]